MCSTSSFTDFFPTDMSGFEMLLAGGTAAAGVATATNALMADEPKSASAAPDRTEADAAQVAEQAKVQRRRLLTKQGKGSLQKTFGFGDTSTPNIMTKTLFGG